MRKEEEEAIEKDGEDSDEKYNETEQRRRTKQRYGDQRISQSNRQARQRPGELCRDGTSRKYREAETSQGALIYRSACVYVYDPSPTRNTRFQYVPDMGVRCSVYFAR